MSDPSPAPLTKPAWIALSGLIPFLLLAIALPVAPDPLAPALVQAMIAYGAVVLAFLGGVRWGAELARAPQAPHLIRLAAAGLQTVPAWIAVLMLNRPLWAITVLLVAGFAHLTWDLSGVRAGLLPSWTYRLRIGLTLIASACLVIAAASQLRLI
jgi:hypothetical protein